MLGYQKRIGWDHHIGDARLRTRHAPVMVHRQSGPPTSLQRRSLLQLGVGLTGFSSGADVWADDATEAIKRVENVKPVPLRLSLLALQNSVPQSWIQDFQKVIGTSNKVKMKTKKNLGEIFGMLATEKGSSNDLVTIGDAWLTRAIQMKYLKPLEDADKYRWYSNLPARWQNLLVRDKYGIPARNGDVWGVPYRWGCTAIAYREDKLKKIGLSGIEDWKDLLHPSLEGRISFLDSPQEFVGVVLKTFGLQYNTKVPEIQSKGISDDMLIKRGRELRSQILTFNDREHIRALAAEDAWVTVGSSLNLLPLAGAITSLKVVIPRSGTALWCDLFVATSKRSQSESAILGTSPLVNAWFDFILSPSRSHGSGLQSGISPLELPEAGQPLCLDGSVQLDLKGRFLPNSCILNRSEFLLPLDKDQAKLFKAILE